MHLLVSCCNVRALGLPALGLLDVAASEFRVLQVPTDLPPLGGITGLAASGTFLFVVVQPAFQPGKNGPPLLLVLDMHDLTICGRHAFQKGKDVHSLCLVGEALYAVSTGTDEVVELRLRGPTVVSERVFWKLPCGGPRADVQHLNAITAQGDELLVSGFGPRTGSSWNSATDGFIYNLTREEKVASGLDQPHSLMVLNGEVAFCESRKKTVRLLDNRRAQVLPGYTRGLCQVGKHLFAGVSVARRISRSTGLVDNPGEEGPLAGRCAIVQVAADSLAIEKTIELGSGFQEIYDLLPLDRAGHWPTVPEQVWQEAALHNLVTALDQQTARARRAEETLASQTGSGADSAEVTDSHLGNGVAHESHIGLTPRRSPGRLARGQARLRKAVRRARDEGRRRDEEILTQLYALRDLLRVNDSAQPAAPGNKQKGPYAALIRRIRQVVREAVPADATLLVVSRGDSELLDLYGRRAWHFPRGQRGVYAGYNPGDSTAAIAHLEALRSQGGDYLLFPATALWWLDHYGDFRQYLERQYELVHQDDACWLFSLHRREQAGGSARPTLEQVLLEFADRFQRDPAILDWYTGLDLARVLPRYAVFTPPARTTTLPYLDETIDVVALTAPEPGALTEASRVASALVVVLERGAGQRQELRARVDWKVDRPVRSSPSVSIVLPCCGRWPLVRASLRALRETIPTDFQGEILVVHTNPKRKRGESPRSRFGLVCQDRRFRILHAPDVSGFAALSNRAAEEATGEFLIFLSPGLIPLPGWLAPLVRLFHDRPSAGVVSAQVLGSDGRLLGAGGVVLPDGTLAGFGQDCYRPEMGLFSHVREIDVGTMPLATSRSLFLFLGGFNSYYRSPSYAGADYSMRVKAAGSRVYYQPVSLAVDLAGEARNAKTPPQRERLRFSRKWAGHGDSLGALTRPRSPAGRKRRKKVLVVGIYLAGQPNTITELVRTFADSDHFDVTQCWVALGGEAPNPEVAAVTRCVLRSRMPKYQILNEFFASHDPSGYDYVISSDDDIHLPTGFLDGFLSLQGDLGFAIAQPARTSSSYVDHPIVEQQRGVLARQTLFVEVGPLVSFHRSIYDMVFPFDLTSPMGWGYENVWALRLAQRGLKMGIIDALPVEHSMRKPVANYSWHEADAARTAYLARHSHLPLEECFRVLDVISASGIWQPEAQARDTLSGVRTPLASASGCQIPDADNLKVSVIIPTWNRAQLLDQSLRSLSTQSLPRSCFEVIVVDDGSTDATPEVCRHWAAHLPLRYFRIRHAGNAAAKNLGIFTALGPILFFFDDDDVAHVDLLRAHWEGHQKHAEETVALLGTTTWHSGLRVTEVMRYITDIGQFLFSYRSLQEGQTLDYRYFWAGRTSCKRSLLVRHGIFCQEFDHSPEDIELGYRLSRFGLRVIYHPRAMQYMNRAVTFVDFCRRCRNQGQAQVKFARRHKAAEIQDYCEIPGAEQRWKDGEALLVEKVRRVAELETLVASGRAPSDHLIRELHTLYGWAFRINKARGIHEEIGCNQVHCGRRPATTPEGSKPLAGG